MRSIRALLLLAVLLLPLGCGGGGTRSSEQSRTTIRVENGNFLQMNIYVLRREGQRARLGSVPAFSTRVFRIPPALVFRATSLRFVADPVGAASLPITHDLQVTEGDEILLRILP